MSDRDKIREDILVIDEKIMELYKQRARLMEDAAKSVPLGKQDVFGFSPREQLKFQGAKVVFQGVEGAYSQQALKEFFVEDILDYHVKSWRDAMEAIARGEADYAVLPIENSSAGIVSENLDLLVEYNNFIIGEQIIKIDHCLLGRKDADITDITDVYSHPQALMQCSRYLDEHKNWEKHSVENTAGAAKRVKEENCKNKAAIASRITADIYGLNILSRGIQNNTSNSTRFIIVTGEKIFKKDAGRLSICFEIPHKSGSLYRTLSHLIYNNLNMNKIESRPIQGKTWEYRFFIDIEGNLMDKSVQNALIKLEEETEKLKILGNY